MLEDNEYVIIYEADHTSRLLDMMEPMDPVSDSIMRKNPLIVTQEMKTPYLMIVKLPNTVEPFGVYLTERRLDEFESMLHKIGCARKKLHFPVTRSDIYGRN